MSLQIASPYIRVEDANGLPYVGARLYVYQPGTTTLASVYTDDGLSIAADNPATSNAKGEFPRIYTAAGTYKLRAETAAGVLIFEEDDIDTGLSAGTGALPVARGGTGATTAAGARSNLDVPSNSELSDLAADIASLRSSIQSLTAFPQGYLTLTSGVPVIASDVTAATAIYYTPLIGNLIPIWNGTSTVITNFSELTLTLVESHVASAIYDCFVINDSGTVRLVTGPAWNTATAGAGARGAGSGTTELTRTVGGLLTNANSMTGRYGATTLTIEANKATYVGSIFMDGTNGQITCHRSYGQSRKWGVWNAYSRKPITLKCGDSTSTWSANSDMRAANGDPANSLSLFSGLAEEIAECRYFQKMSGLSGGSAVAAQNGVGLNSTTAASGKKGNYSLNSGSASTAGDAVASYTVVPSLGMNVVTALEAGLSGVVTLGGTETNMLLTANWMG
jgi:hypothetical protein